MIDILLRDTIEFLKLLIATTGPIGLFFAMILQAIIFPVPSESILALAGAAFVEKYGLELGLFLAIVFGILGSLAGATISFYISRKGGYTVVKKFVSEEDLEFATIWFERNGFWAVLFGRLLPFIPFDGISYASGLTPIKFRDFIIPTFIGLIPRVIFYSAFGIWADSLLKTQFELGLLIIALFIVALYGLYRIVFSRLKAANRRFKEEKNALYENGTILTSNLELNDDQSS